MIWVVGGIPHDHLGQEVRLINERGPRDFGNGLVAQCSMSGKLRDEHPADYYVKVSNYVDVLSRYARAVDPETTHRNYPPRPTLPDDSVFLYHDAATSRAGLSAIVSKLKIAKVAIVGLGGTGAYILDLLAKTPISELHLFDHDVLLAHNAFRFPGAVSLDRLRGSPKKVQYLAEEYGRVRRGIFAHPIAITGANLLDLREMSFVFLAMDNGPGKKLILDALEEWGSPFIDCGMGVIRQENSLRASLRVTTGSEGHYSHIGSRVSFASDRDDEYDSNIQTTDLNMMNAAMAVLKFKKIIGYYVDDKLEFNTIYTVARNQMVSGAVGE